MAHKSKTQRQKASAAKANRKERIERDEDLAKQVAEEAEARANGVEVSAKAQAKPVKVAERPKKKRFQFLRDVRAELKRVTWPTRQDVLRWSGVVVGALLFFGVYVAVLDNLIVTPALLALSSLG